MSAVLATKAAELVREGVVSENVYFTGGAEIKKTPFAGLVLPQVIKAGYPEPGSQETEADYMQRVFHLKMGQGFKGVGIIREAEARNTGENCKMVARLGAENEASLTLVTLPYHAVRTVATWRKQVSAHQPLRPIMVWPEKELGITSRNWRSNLLALYMVSGESAKILGEDPAYVRKGFCARPNPSRDRALFENVQRLQK